MNNLEKQLIDKLRKSDIHLTVSRLAEDLSGYDITIGDKKNRPEGNKIELKEE